MGNAVSCQALGPVRKSNILTGKSLDTFMNIVFQASFGDFDRNIWRYVHGLALTAISFNLYPASCPRSRNGKRETGAQFEHAATRSEKLDRYTYPPPLPEPVVEVVLDPIAIPRCPAGTRYRVRPPTSVVARGRPSSSSTFGPTHRPPPPPPRPHGSDEPTYEPTPTPRTRRLLRRQITFQPCSSASSSLPFLPSALRRGPRPRS